LASLAPPDHEREPIEVHVLHPQAQCLVDAHARAVKQPRQQAEFARHLRQHGGDFVDRQDDGQALWPLGPLQILQPRKFDLQHRSVKEEQGR
jgi:hypothetical protein